MINCSAYEVAEPYFFNRGLHASIFGAPLPAQCTITAIFILRSVLQVIFLYQHFLEYLESCILLAVILYQLDIRLCHSAFNKWTHSLRIQKYNPSLTSLPMLPLLVMVDQALNTNCLTFPPVQSTSWDCIKILHNRHNCFTPKSRQPLAFFQPIWHSFNMHVPSFPSSLFSLCEHWIREFWVTIVHFACLYWLLLHYWALAANRLSRSSAMERRTPLPLGRDIHCLEPLPITNT